MCMCASVQRTGGKNNVAQCNYVCYFWPIGRPKSPKSPKFKKKAQNLNPVSKKARSPIKVCFGSKIPNKTRNFQLRTNKASKLLLPMDIDCCNRAFPQYRLNRCCPGPRERNNPRWRAPKTLDWSKTPRRDRLQKTHRLLGLETGETVVDACFPGNDNCRALKIMPGTRSSGNEEDEGRKRREVCP